MGRARGARPRRAARAARTHQRDESARRADRGFARRGRRDPARPGADRRRASGSRENAPAARRARERVDDRRLAAGRCAGPRARAHRRDSGDRRRSRGAQVLRRAPRGRHGRAAAERALSGRNRRGAVALPPVAAPERPRRQVRRRGGGGDRGRELRPPLSHHRPWRRELHRVAVGGGDVHEPGPRAPRDPRATDSRDARERRRAAAGPLRGLVDEPGHERTRAALGLGGARLSAARGERQQRARRAGALAGRSLADLRPHAPHVGGHARADFVRRLGPQAARARARGELAALPGHDRAQLGRADPHAPDDGRHRLRQPGDRARARLHHRRSARPGSHRPHPPRVPRHRAQAARRAAARAGQGVGGRDEGAAQGRLLALDRAHPQQPAGRAERAGGGHELPRRHRAQAGRGRAAAAGAAAAAGREDGGGRAPRRRHRPRLQQHPRRHPRLRGAPRRERATRLAPEALRRQRAHRCESRRQPGGADPLLQPQPAGQAGRGRLRRHRGGNPRARARLASPGHPARDRTAPRAAPCRRRSDPAPPGWR